MYYGNTNCFQLGLLRLFWEMDCSGIKKFQSASEKQISHGPVQKFIQEYKNIYIRKKYIRINDWFPLPNNIYSIC